MTELRRSAGRRSVGRRVLLAMVALLVALATAVVTVPTASAETYQRISGEGSSWAANAIDAMRVNVRQFGMTVDYNPSGSSAGRKNFLNGTVDFAASDIPFQFNPEDGSAPENPAAGSYAYIPVVAGGTSFMYNLKINGKRVTNLRLSGENVAKIFTGVISQWNDAALQADNPGIILPARTIVPVVRSDGSGSSAQFTKWMISQYPQVWTDYCNKSGRAPACGFTSFYPTIPGMIAQSGDLGIAGYVSQSFAEGAIGYVNYSYALGAQFPVAKVLNKAGFYTEPTPQNVAVSLLQAKINTDATDPTVYLTQNLDGVYVDTDPRNYVLSSYSYLIVPTVVAGQFSLEKGKTLGAFAYYAMCQAQQQSASLGYSPMPINLVQASFDQIKKIPGVVVQNIDITQCKNPTFAPDGSNLLADTAPKPKACDQQGGVTQCADGTAGLANIQTAVKPGGATPAAAGGGAGATGAGGATATTVKKNTGKPTTSTVAAAGGGSTTTVVGGATDSTVPTDGSTPTATVPAGNGCDPTTGCAAPPAQDQLAIGAITPITLGQDTGWSSSLGVILLVVALLLGVVLVPAIVWRYFSKRTTS